MRNLKKQGTKAFLWDFSGKIASQGIGFIITIFLARLLEPSDFGLIALVMVVIAIAGIFNDIGLGGALIQRRRVLSIHYSSVFYFNIFVSVLLTLITFFSASWIAEFYDSKELVTIIEVMSILFVIGALSGVQSVILRKNLNYALLTKISLVSSLISGVIGIVLAFNGAGVWSLVVQTLVSGVISNILIWSNTQWFPSLNFSVKALIQLWGFGFRMFLSGLLDSIFTRLDFIIIGKLFSLEILGFFQRAKGLNLLVISYASSSLMSVLFPVLSKVQNDLPRFQNIIIKALGIISFITFFLLGLLYVNAEELIVLIFGIKWLPSVQYFEILALSGYAYPVSALLVNVLSSRGNSRAFLKLEIYKKLIQASNLYIGFLFGINGYLYGLAITAILGVSLNILFVTKEIHLSFMQLVKPIVVQAFITILVVVVIVFVDSSLDLSNILSLLFKGTLFAVLYFIFNYLFKTTSFKYFLEQALPIYQQKFQQKKELNGL